MREKPVSTRTLICPECGAFMTLRKSEYGLFYGCTKFPVCKTTHGAHKDTGEPLGIPGDEETKKLRIEAHDQFDHLWKGGAIKRVEAYVWLQHAMKMDKDAVHIGRFTKDQCRTLLILLKESRDANRGKTEMEIAFERAQGRKS